MADSTEPHRSLAQPRRGFFPRRTGGGILLPGEESETLFSNTGKAQWHRRADWESGAQTWQTSTLPPEVARECVEALRALLDGDKQLRGALSSALRCLEESDGNPLQVAVTAPLPHEPQKTITEDTTEIVFPGGYVGDAAVILVRKVTVAAPGRLRNESKLYWRQPRNVAVGTAGDLPPDIVKDAIDVIERMVDLVTWMRASLRTLPQTQVGGL